MKCGAAHLNSEASMTNYSQDITKEQFQPQQRYNHTNKLYCAIAT